MADNLTRRNFLKSSGVGITSGLVSMVLSSCEKKEAPSKANKNININKTDIPGKNEITLHVKKEVYKLVAHSGHTVKTSEWMRCLWDDKGDPHYVGYVGISDGKFCLASDGNAPFILSLGKLTNIKPDPKYNKFPIDANNIDFLGKTYSVLYADPNEITLKLL